MAKKHHYLRDQASPLSLMACSGDKLPNVRGRELVPWLETLVDHFRDHIQRSRKRSGFRYAVAVAVRKNNPSAMDQLLDDYGFLDDIPVPAEHEGETSGNVGAQHSPRPHVAVGGSLSPPHRSVRDERPPGAV